MCVRKIKTGVEIKNKRAISSGSVASDVNKRGIVSLFAVPPMLSIPNQLEAAYIGQDVTLECHTEAYPISINYWTTEHGDMIVSGNLLFLSFPFNVLLLYNFEVSIVKVMFVFTS